jgi:hypothetical protein
VVGLVSMIARGLKVSEYSVGTLKSLSFENCASPRHYIHIF